MSFDYNWTCSYIDQDISSFKEASFETCKYFLTRIVDEYEIDISEADFTNEVKDLADEIYNGAEDIFDNTRSHNTDMRDEADKQVDILKGEVEELAEERDNLQKRVEELEEDLDNLQVEFDSYAVTEGGL